MLIYLLPYYSARFTVCSRKSKAITGANGKGFHSLSVNAQTLFVVENFISIASL
jgi:hypothetical protein